MRKRELDISKIWNKLLASDSLKKIYIISTGVLFVRALILTIYHCGLYADGSAEVVDLLFTNQVYLWYPPRKGSFLLIRLLPYVLIKIGIQNFRVLLYAFSLSSLIWASLLIMMSLRLCYKSGDSRLMDHSLILWGISATFIGLYLVHESFIAAAAMWFVFVCIKNWNYVGRHKSWLIWFFFILCFSLYGLYESVAFFGAAILLYAFVSLWKTKTMPVCPVCYLLGCLLLLANVLYEGYYIYNPVSQELKDGFLNQLLHQPLEKLILLTLFAVFLLGIELSKAREGMLLEKMLWLAEILLAGGYFLYVACASAKIVSESLLSRSLICVVLPMAFLIFEIILLCFSDRRVRNVRLLPAVMGVACLLFAFSAGTGYYQYLKDFSTITMNSQGFVKWGWYTRNIDDSYAIGWTIPDESVLSSALFSPGEPVRSIVVQRKEDIYYQPFDRWDIDQYRDLSAYGIQYDRAAFNPTVYLTPYELVHVNCSGEGWNVDDLVLQGISYNEIFFSWTNGNTLSFRPIQIAQYDGSPLYLDLNIAVVYHAPQRLIAYCGEEKVFETAVGPESGTVKVPLQADSDGKLQIRIELPDAISPDEVEDTGDTRQLAFALTGMSITTKK